MHTPWARPRAAIARAGPSLFSTGWTFIWLLLLPFGIFPEADLSALLPALVMSVMLLGLEDAAIQLEDPFRHFAYGGRRRARGGRRRPALYMHARALPARARARARAPPQPPASVHPSPAPHAAEAMLATVSKDMPRAVDEVKAARAIVAKKYEPLMHHPAGFVALPPFPVLPPRPQLR